MKIGWKLERLDEGAWNDRAARCSLLELTGRISREDELIGAVKGFYLFAYELDSAVSFWELWDIDARTCEVFEEIRAPDRNGFREPLPRLLEEAPGLLYVESIVLLPRYRGLGLGREVMRETVEACADERVGAVLLCSEPMQYEGGGHDGIDPELEDLPRDDRERDRLKLQSHFRTWGMQRLPCTNFMVSAPGAVSEATAATWPPCVIQDHSNTCMGCGGLIDKEGEEWEEGEDGPMHSRCWEVEEGGS